MDLVAAEIFSSILVFAVLIGCSFIPFMLISCRRRDSSSVKDHTSTRTSKWSDKVPLLSLCNCFAAGVFLATCFLGLVPHVREHVFRYERMQSGNKDEMSPSNGSLDNGDADSHHKMHKTMPWTEVLLIGGFLMILLIEELIHVFQHCDCTTKRKTSKKSNGKLLHDKMNSKQRHLEDQPLITAGECPDDIEGAEKLHMHDISPERRHAHDHHDPSTILADGHMLNWRSVALLMGLGIHGAFEGVALGLQESSEALFSLLFGVMTHEVLCAIAFGINLSGHKIRFGVGFLTIVLFSLSIPLGMVGGIIVHRRQTNSTTSLLVRIILEGLAAGTFVYVAFIDMLNNELATNKCRLAKVLCVCFGFLLFFGLTFFT